MVPRLYTRNPTRMLYTRENNSVVHANADAYDGVDGDGDGDDDDDEEEEEEDEDEDDDDEDDDGDDGDG